MVTMDQHTRTRGKRALALIRMAAKIEVGVLHTSNTLVAYIADNSGHKVAP